MAHGNFRADAQEAPGAETAQSAASAGRAEAGQTGPQAGTPKPIQPPKPVPKPAPKLAKPMPKPEPPAAQPARAPKPRKPVAAKPVRTPGMDDEPVIIKIERPKAVFPPVPPKPAARRIASEPSRMGRVVAFADGRGRNGYGNHRRKPNSNPKAGKEK